MGILNVEKGDSEGSASMQTSPQSYIGVGLYSIPEAARLLKVPAGKLKRWADGYTFRADGSRAFSEPVIGTEFQPAADLRIVTFLELIELMFVSLFREQGVSMKVIRAAAANAAKLFDTHHPFAAKRFDTDGKRIFVTLNSDEAKPTGISDSRLVQELALSQYVFGHIARPFFRKLEFGEREEAMRYWPLGKRKRVVLDPQRAFGKPIDAETGVPTYVLYQASLGGNDDREIARWYEIPLDAVRCAIEYETFLTA